MTSKEAQLLAALVNGESVDDFVPTSRMEAYLKNCCLACGCDGLPAPISTTDALLYRLAEQLASGGGVTIRNQNKTITENGEYTHDAGYTGLGVVTVNVEASGGGGNALLHSILDRSITEFIDHEIVCIGSYAFYECKSLKTVKCNNATFAYSRAFASCTALETADLPNCAPGAATPAYLFQGCTALHTVNIPEFTRLGSRSFSGCKVLEKLDLPKVNMIDGLSFENCTLLSVMILRNNVVASLSNINAFNNTPFASGGTGGTVYCPASLITQYQQATNWSTLYAAGTCNFVAIEGSEYE